jgi:hypothetical protein
MPDKPDGPPNVTHNFGDQILWAAAVAHSDNRKSLLQQRVEPICSLLWWNPG